MARSAVNDNGVWRYEGFQTVVEEPEPPAGRETLKSVQGGHEQRWPSYANQFVRRPIYALKQCHPSLSGRPSWRSGVNTFFAEQNAEGWLPRLCILHGLCMSNETLDQIIAGDQDDEFEFLCDKVSALFDQWVGKTHPVTGKRIRGCDLFAWDINHEQNIKSTPFSPLKVGNTTLKLANATRHVIDLFRDREPGFEDELDRPLMIWCPSATANLDAAIDSYPGDDYMDVIAMDIYAGGVGGTNDPVGGSWDNPTQHRASWDRINTGMPFSISKFFAFVDAVAADSLVARCNSSAHPGEADLHGGRTVAKPWGWIEFGMIAVDKKINATGLPGHDQIIDGGSGDNTVAMTGFLDRIAAECAKPLRGKQATYGQRTLFTNYFDINDIVGTAHRLTPETNPDKWGYPTNANPFPNAGAIFKARVCGPA